MIDKQAMSTINPGVLYVVATPIGHQGDLSPRAKEVLEQVDLVLAEDTRHTGRLLKHLGIQCHLRSLHEHNERAITAGLIEQLQKGAAIALVSDAGTPLISDPGFFLVRECHGYGLSVSPVPGACAAIAALSVSGLPTDHFTFEGFLPAKSAARLAALEVLSAQKSTLVFYESSHRILSCLADMCQIFGESRHATLCRELTKRYETVRSDTLSDLCEWVSRDADQQRGEFVIVVAGNKTSEQADHQELDKLLRVLMVDVSLKTAAGMASRYFGIAKNEAYQRALSLKNQTD